MKNNSYLECEKRWVFWLLMFVAGYFGAFAILLRGGAFCNAQTANLVILGIALGTGDWNKALYYLVPFASYIFGTIISEILGKKIKKVHLLRWDTFLILFETIVVFILGLIPEMAPVQITQIALNFICAMQYNTFRQAQGIPLATTFCTNHIRQMGSNFVKYLRHHDKKILEKWVMPATMLLCFIAGATISAFAGKLFQGKSIWGAALVLLFIFIKLAIADLTYEKNLLDKVPSGH